MIGVALCCCGMCLLALAASATSGQRSQVGGKAKFSISNELRCWDSVTVAYKRIESSEHPSSLDHARAICNTEEMTLCTFPKLVALFDSPVRDFVAEWAFADFGTAEWREARVGWGCETRTETECYDGKISNTPIVESEPKAVHCCSNIIPFCVSPLNLGKVRRLKYLDSSAIESDIITSTAYETTELPTYPTYPTYEGTRDEIESDIVTSTAYETTAELPTYPTYEGTKSGTDITAESAKPFFIQDELVCVDGIDKPYKRVKSKVVPKSVDTCKDFCGRNDMTLCTLDELVLVHDCSTRKDTYDWALVDNGTGNMAKSRIGYGPCREPKCYNGKVPNVSKIEANMDVIHCCKDIMGSCAAPKDSSVINVPAQTTSPGTIYVSTAKTAEVFDAKNESNPNHSSWATISSASIASTAVLTVLW